MAHRILVAPKVPDVRSQQLLRSLQTNASVPKLSAISQANCYTLDLPCTKQQLQRVADVLTNPIAEQCSIDRVSIPRGATHAIEIGYLPGVTDNVGTTTKATIEDALGKKFRAGEMVYSSSFFFLFGRLTRTEVQRITDQLYNPLIERATVTPISTGVRIPLIVPRVTLSKPARAKEVELQVSDEELAEIGRKGILDDTGQRRGPLALSFSYMRTIRDHFDALGRNPTDIELESLAQTWSEHCKHTIFADPLDEVTEGIYKRYIKGATQQIRKQKGKKDFCVSVFTDNSGAIEFDDAYLVTHKVETHNSPSALDPYGGAITGIVGVNRDCLGFGLGAKPIANVYGFCVASPEDKTMLYRDKEKKQPLLPARRILEGVVRGINAGGNQSGIPTPLGFVATDPRYRGKPLVFAGTVGLIPKKVKGRKMWEKEARPGDYIVMIGGRVGLDGIHGATFSSEALSSGSPATAVQIGDPITQKKLSDMLIREARDRFLYTSITDNGAGGLSCSVAEMAKECGGCDVNLDTVPLKYPGLEPWQIWISESQERMTLAVPPSKWKEFKKLCDTRDVEATKIGVFTKKQRCIVRAGGKVVMDLDMDFLHDGRPVHAQVTKKIEHTSHQLPKASRAASSTALSNALLKILRSPNVGSTAFISQQYDHEVQASAVTKPLQGKGRVQADAAVLKPVPSSDRGVVLSQGYCPWYSDLDTYAMAAAAIDSAVRGAVCAGAPLGHLAILDNFCWSSSNTPERLYELKQAAKACFDVATAFGTPFISGKDSMFNDFRGFDAKGKPIHIAAPPTLLISAIAVVPDSTRAITLDLKCSGDILYLLGETNDELGGSEYASVIRSSGGVVPHASAAKSLKTYAQLERAIALGLIASATSVGRGGVAAALAKACVAGQLGVSVDLTRIPGGASAPDSILFSESQGRVLVSVRPGHVTAFEKLLRAIPYQKIGAVSSDSSVNIRVKKEHLERSVAELTRAYRSAFLNW